MKLKRTLLKLSGIISSVNVEVKARTHFTGELFKKIIIVDQDGVQIKEENKTKSRLDKFRITFELDLKNRPNEMKLWELRDILLKVNNYNAYTGNSTYYDLKFNKYQTVGPILKGYQILNWLFITTENLDEYNTSYFINAFAINFEHSCVKVDKDGARRIVVEEEKVFEKDVDKFLQKVLMDESVLFINDCIIAVS